VYSLVVYGLGQEWLLVAQERNWFSLVLELWGGTMMKGKVRVNRSALARVRDRGRELTWSPSLSMGEGMILLTVRSKLNRNDVRDVALTVLYLMWVWEVWQVLERAVGNGYQGPIGLLYPRLTVARTDKEFLHGLFSPLVTSTKDFDSVLRSPYYLENDARILYLKFHLHPQWTPGVDPEAFLRKVQVKKHPLIRVTGL